MSIKLNGTYAESVKFNGVDLTKVRFNGVEVFSKVVVHNPLCFTALENNTGLRWTVHGTLTNMPHLLFKINDDDKWDDLDIEDDSIVLQTGDKVYFKGTTATFSESSSNYISLSSGGGSIAASGEVDSLINGSSLTPHCFYRLFYMCTNLTIPPELPATTLADYCYDSMFFNCTSIKLSETQTGEYQTPYRIPSSGTGITASDALTNMFSYTGGTFKGTPEINTTYYLANN